MAKPMADGVTSWRGFHKVTQRRLAMRDVKALPTIIERGVALGVVGSAHREAFKDALIRSTPIRCPSISMFSPNAVTLRSSTIFAGSHKTMTLETAR